MITKLPLTLSTEFKDVLDQMERTSDHLFITGRAGTGKSTLLHIFRSTTQKKVVVLAPTGIAALNVRGQTIHSFFRFPPRMLNKSEIRKQPNASLYKSIQAIVIDEVSMVRADIMDNIDYFLRVNRGSELPFGGVQMYFFGDLFQLPPVLASQFEREYFRDHYKTPYFFSSEVITQRVLGLKMLELHHVYRQEERRFINLLDTIRLNQIEEDDLILLNSRYQLIPSETKYHITLCATNATADAINRAALQSLDTPFFNYTALITGAFDPRLFPTDQILMLKVGAQVMFIKNDMERRYVNGTIGSVVRLDDKIAYISILDSNSEEKEIPIYQEEWEIIKYIRNETNPKEIDVEVVGTFTQFPIKLAWAITIHKSQGKTFDRVIIDLGFGAFEFGQTYVALSRCRTLDGIYLRKPIKPKDIMSDNAVEEYYDFMRRYS